MAADGTVRKPIYGLSQLTAKDILGSAQGAFTMDAAASKTITDANINSSNATVTIFPTNGPGGLLLRTKSCFVSNIQAGSFVFNCSASGAGAPAGTETFGYEVTN